MFHTHKWGPVEAGYQYCKKCGLASCVHMYELIETIKFHKEWDLGANPDIKSHMTYVSRCKNCGIIISEIVE